MPKTKRTPEKLHFTKETLSTLRTRPKEGRRIVFDEHTAGLGLVLFPSGTRTFFHLKYVNNYPRRTTIGRFPDLTIEQARGKANELNGKFAKWKANDYEGPDPVVRPKKISTLGEALDHYVEHHLTATAKNPSYARWQFGKYCSGLRNRPLGTIRREHIRDLHAEIAAKHGGVTANRTIQLLRRIFYHAAHPDIALWDGANPCAKPKKFMSQEQSRDRTIRREEAPGFFKQLGCEPNRDLHDFLLLALATGARHGTILAMRAEEIDWQRELWIIPNPKGKKGKEPHVVPLTKIAISVLKDRDQKEWIFPGRKGHLTTLKKPWKQFRERTGIADLTMHDLRRTLATHEGETGASTEVIQKTLGHEESSAATKIYDRSDRRDDVRDAMEGAVRAMLVAGKTTKRKLLEASHE